MNPLTSREKGRRYQQPLVAMATQYVMPLLLGFPHTHIKYANLVPEGRTHPHPHFSSFFFPSPKPNPHACRFKSVVLQTNPDDNGRDKKKPKKTPRAAWRHWQAGVVWQWHLLRPCYPRHVGDSPIIKTAQPQERCWTWKDRTSGPGKGSPQHPSPSSASRGLSEIATEAC